MKLLDLLGTLVLIVRRSLRQHALSTVITVLSTGLASGLEEELFQPTGEVQREFYAEKPISIRLKGSYHELGDFVSGIAALPRIVTLHDIEITKSNRDEETDLTLNVTAKTYRYLEDEERAGGSTQ